jgi:trigger factor
VISFGEAEPFVFRVTFATLPEVTLPDSSGLEIEVPAMKAVGDEDVNDALGDVQQQFGVLGALEGDTVSEGDLVRVKEGEQEWDTRAMSDNPVTRHLVGAAVGSTVEIDTELEEGKPFKASLEVTGLRQVILPEIDDDLAKDAGYDDLGSLKADIKDRLGKRRTEVHEQIVQSGLMEALLEKMEIPLPEAFVDDVVDEEVTHLRESLERQPSGQTFSEYLEAREQTEEELRSEVRDSVQKRIRRELVLRQLAEDLEISVDDDELQSLAETEAAEYGEDPIRFVARLKAEDRWESYRLSKVNERIFGALRETATIKEGEA